MSRSCPIPVLMLLCVVPVTRGDYTTNIMLTGYWPVTNHMIRPFSTNPEQNPDGWIGGNWEDRGYDIYSFFPEFTDENWPIGEGDFEVDYQDTSADFWRIVDELDPLAIVTFSRGDPRRRDWEIEMLQRNLEEWINDYREPFQPTPSPPDDSVPPGYIRESSLPVVDIMDAVNEAELGVNAWIDDDGFGGGFLSEFIAYHGTWYHDLHADENDPTWNIAGGHIHVGGRVTLEQGIPATEITLRELTDYLDEVVPEPSTGVLLLALLGAAQRLRRLGLAGLD
ncbi:MAG TPA: PEP-CTERM sorting domain-containing protein [Phycisphaerae bacterium]|nr:PEP-CTERM sorting domain-containing protein [Phycisphaerae bacterium]